jgi:hypothetical protein
MRICGLKFLLSFVGHKAGIKTIPMIRVGTVLDLGV